MLTPVALQRICSQPNSHFDQKPLALSRSLSCPQATESSYKKMIAAARVLLEIKFHVRTETLKRLDLLKKAIQKVSQEPCQIEESVIRRLVKRAKNPNDSLCKVLIALREDKHRFQDLLNIIRAALRSF